METEKKQESEIPSKLSYYWDTYSRNLRKNGRFYAFLNTIMFATAIYFIAGIDNRLNKMEETIAIKGSSVISVTSDGRVSGVVKELLQPRDYGPVVASIITQYLPRSKVDLMKKGFSDYDNWVGLFRAKKGPGSLREFYNTFIQIRSKDEKRQKQKKEMERDFANYLTNLNISMRKNSVPYTMDTIGYELEKKDYKVVGNNFIIKVKVNVVTSGVTEGGWAFSNRLTYGEFTLQGYIDTDESLEVKQRSNKKRNVGSNPFGIKFTSLKALPPKTPKDAVIKRKATTLEKKLNRQKKLKKQ